MEKSIGKDEILLVNLEILNTDFLHIFTNINNTLQKAWGTSLGGNKPKIAMGDVCGWEVFMF